MGQDAEEYPPRPIHVLHVLGNIDAKQGGSVRAVTGIAQTTVAAGDRATILATIDRATDDLSVIRSAECADLVLQPRQWPARYCVSLPLLRWLLRRVPEFDLVEVHEVFAFPTFAAWLACRLRRVPLIVHPHNSLDPYDLRKHAKAKRLLRPVLRRVLGDARAIWLTAQLEADRVDDYGAGTRRVITPLSVDRPEVEGDAEAFRRKHDIADDAPVALFLGRFDPKKGLERLIAAFERVHAVMPDARLVVAGAGEESYAKSVRSMLVGSSASSSIVEPGFLSGSDKADAFAAADLFVLHSDNENFGLAVVEALHHGVPVLLSDQVYIASELEAAGVAVVVPLTDTDGLAEQLHVLLDDAGQKREGGQSRLAELRANALVVAERFLPETVARADATVRRELLAEV
ncbi:MAG: glycosyltransferase [Actinomycetota bacterium]|jgi:glycosyltransferase involved in cell wall biosynthesis|nr:glycosyltransferase [Actinomycetota bacterium]